MSNFYFKLKILFHFLPTGVSQTESPRKLVDSIIQDTNMSNAEEPSPDAPQHQGQMTSGNNNNEDAIMMCQIFKERSLRAEKLVDEFRRRVSKNVSYMTTSVVRAYVSCKIAILMHNIA